AKSRTPLLVLAAEAGVPTSNFFVAQDELAEAVGAVAERVHSPDSAATDTVRAWARATHDRRTVVLNLPLDVQRMEVRDVPRPSPPAAPPAPAAEESVVDELARLLAAAERPVFIAGRGARLAQARQPLADLAEACGALLATSAVAKGFFRSHPRDLDVSGGFATPLAAELITAADLIVAWGCSLTMWTTRHGRLIADGATVVHVDSDPAAIGRNHPVHLGVVGDVRAVAAGALEALGSARPTGYRTEEVAQRLAAGRRWRDVPFDDDSAACRIDPRTLTIGLDDLLPPERILAVDSGNFMGYPSMFLDVPDDDGFCFTQSYQSIGLGLSTAIGAALARPDRLAVAALGDGGALMSICELDTVVRLGLPMIVVVYNDEAYGAEVHHFGPSGHPLDTVRFPETDIAAIGRGFGCDAVTVRATADLDGVRRWLDGPRTRPLVVDAKVTEGPSWWLEEAFRGH
nr:thiamine pyrophosphate-binding protein [Geodermatophilaceae bacterium]